LNLSMLASIDSLQVDTDEPGESGVADTGMDPAKMKAMLAASKREPVNCALGQTKAGVMMMLDKQKGPKMLLKELEKKFSDLKAPNWGTAFVDVDEDPKLVILTLEKPPGGVAKRLKLTLKGTGFSKVEIRKPDGSVAEKVGEADVPDGPEGAADPAAEAPAAPAAAAPEPAPEAAAAEPPPPAEAAAEPPAPPAAAAPPPAGPDTSALTRQLTDLVKRMVPMMGADPARAASLKALATQAQANLKSGDLAAAQSAMADLQKALAQPAPPAAAGAAANGAAASGAAANGAAANGAATGGPPNAAALEKARLAWGAARKRVESEVDKLHAEMTSAYKDHGFGGELDTFFKAKVEPILHNLDDTLVHKLDEVTKNTNPAQHAQLVAEAQKIVQKYEAYLAGEPLIAKLDNNPFVPLQIEKTLVATLTALSRAIV
jgi:hypothetical protein